MTPALLALNTDPQEYLTRSSALQYVWRARKQPRPRLTVAATMLDPVGGVSHVRVIYPLRAIAGDASVITHIMRSEAPATEPDAPHVCILHRAVLMGPQGLAKIRGLLADGWVIVTEFDDHPDFFRSMQGDEHLTFRGVHAVQTGTQALADILRTRNPEVMVFPNAIHALPEPRNFRDPAAMTLFFGALNREADWEKLMPALNAVAGVVGDRLRFQVVHDRAFFDALEFAAQAIHPNLRP